MKKLNSFGNNCKKKEERVMQTKVQLRNLNT